MSKFVKVWIITSIVFALIAIPLVVFVSLMLLVFGPLAPPIHNSQIDKDTMILILVLVLIFGLIAAVSLSFYANKLFKRGLILPSFTLATLSLIITTFLLLMGMGF